MSEAGSFGFRRMPGVSVSMTSLAALSSAGDSARGRVGVHVEPAAGRVVGQRRDDRDDAGVGELRRSSPPSTRVTWPTRPRSTGSPPGFAKREPLAVEGLQGVGVQTDGPAAEFADLRGRFRR